MRVAVITFPGSNCDYDGYQALQAPGGLRARVPLAPGPGLGDVDAVFLPGGFSYGDYLRPGAIAHLSPVMEAVKDFAAGGGPVVGVCNGFQVLCESGLLPGALLRNETLRFRSHDVHLRVETTRSPFTSAYGRARCSASPSPTATGTTPPRRRSWPSSRGRTASPSATAPPTASSRPANPNGSAHHIAGILNAGGTCWA
jgi:phosphoribosylformylglycinamidine synthase subunit PurQ / glutaminase